MNTQLTTLVTKTTGCATSPRPKAAAIAASYAHDRAANGINGPIAGTSWLLATRKSMTVPAFHDRWPLCSST